MARRTQTCTSRNDIPTDVPVQEALHALVRQVEALSLGLAALARSVEAEAAAAKRREEQQAARLGEARRELAEARAALEKEKVRRRQAEQRALQLEQAVAAARAALDVIPTPVAPDEMTPAGEAAGDEGDATAPEAAVSSRAPDALMADLTDAELDALDRLAARDGHAGRVALVRHFCLQALAGAGLLAGSPAPGSGP